MEMDDSQLDKIMENLEASAGWGQVSIDTSIEETTPDSYGFPIQFKYVPKLTIKQCPRLHHVYKGGGTKESPNQELVRIKARIKSLETALTFATKFEEMGEYKIKINDLSQDGAKEQLRIYMKELARVQEEHKNYAYK